MMRAITFSPGMTAVAMLSGGCTGEAGATLDGRDVVAKSSAFHGAAGTSFDDESKYFSLGSRVFRVTKSEVSASRDQLLALPAEWSRLELIERGTNVVVRADGKHIGQL